MKFVSDSAHPASRRQVRTPWDAGQAALSSILNYMANKFGTDILIQAPDPRTAAAFYVDQLGFEITGETPMIALDGRHSICSSGQSSSEDPRWK